MGIEKVFNMIKNSKDWKEYEARKKETLDKCGMTPPDFTRKKSDLERKIDDFSRVDGLLIISNSERKKLIEEEVELNKKEKSSR